MLTPAQILNCKDFEIKALEVKEWGGEINIRTYSIKHRDLLEQAMMDKKVDGLSSKMFMYSVCDVDGKLMFSEKDFQVICEKNGKVMNRIIKQIAEFNRIQDIEEKSKN
jgi:hypothetical protein